MICALLDFEQVNPVGISSSPFSGLPTFRCKMPILPSDVPSMMGLELLQAQIKQDREGETFTQASLLLLDNAENCHNNTLKNEILLTQLDHVYRRYYPNGIDTSQGGINTYRSDNRMKAIKIYIPTKQNYLYFQLVDKQSRTSNGYWNIINNAKMIVRLTFDTKQNEYQPKRIML